MIAPPGTPGGLGLSFATPPPGTGSPQAKESPPDYLSPRYFQRLREVLEYSREQGRQVVFYDETGFPSGLANHTVPDHLRRRVLRKSEEELTGPRDYQRQLPGEGVVMSVVAMDTKSLARIDLSGHVRDGVLRWNAPAGTWKVMVFTSAIAQARGSGIDYGGAVDYLDPRAARWFVDTVYEPHAKALGQYFGWPLTMSFFDDVGIFNQEKTWTDRFNQAFRRRFGRSPALYYPALWEDIGPETAGARAALFDTRAELLANGFPKVLTAWGNRHHLAVSGHCPGNYDIQPVDMNGDPFKFYRAQPIPMVDVIFGYPLGRDGYKLVSDGADSYDKPIVAAETFEAFSPGGQKSGYRRLMELYVRGINRLVGADQSSAPAIGGPATFTEWAGRNSLLLQGGQRVSDIAVFYPIAALEAFYRFDSPDYTREMRYGTFVPYDTDYLAVGEMLLNEVHRDFTFVHPEVLLSDKMRIDGSELILRNKVNLQRYRVLILPGETVISLRALRKVKAYFDAGGSIIATSVLPSKAAELATDAGGAQANDSEVRNIIQEMFGIDSAGPMPDGVTSMRTGAGKGRTIFIRRPTAALLQRALADFGSEPDVSFVNNPTPSSGGGAFSYLHKRKEGHEIYFFANSSDDAVVTTAELRGAIEPQLWDPLTGRVSIADAVEYVERDGQTYTRLPLKLDPVTAMFVVGETKR
jgi:hypothetical protein